MDLGITGRKAIVCASSRGLGRGCALHLARGRLRRRPQRPRHGNARADSQPRSPQETGAKVDFVAADVSTHDGQKALLDACPSPDILVNNNGGPPRRDFRELTREDMLEGVTQNMVTPIELVQKVLDGMCERGFGRIVNITSLSVYTAIPGLDLSSGARAGLTSFLPASRAGPPRHNVTINNMLPGKMDTDRLRGGFAFMAQRLGITLARGDEPARSNPYRQDGSARRTNLARFVPSFAPSMPVTSRAAISWSMAASTRMRSELST